jgi:hypothetical protein
VGAGDVAGIREEPNCGMILSGNSVTAPQVFAIMLDEHAELVEYRVSDMVFLWHWRDVDDEPELVAQSFDGSGVMWPVSCWDNSRYFRPVKRGSLNPGIRREMYPGVVQGDLVH